MASDKGKRYKVRRQLLTAQTCAPPLPLTMWLSAKEKGCMSRVLCGRAKVGTHAEKKSEVKERGWA